MPGATQWQLRLVAALLLLAGCETELRSGVPEEEANALVLALAEANVGATKEREGRGRGAPRYTVKVLESDAPRAIAILNERGVPPEPKPGMAELFEKKGWVPTSTEERARYLGAVSGELARSLESMDGIIDARVHLASPEGRTFALDEDRPKPQASVLLKRARGGPEIDETAVRKLVAGAVEGLRPEDVAIVSTVAKAPRANAPSLVRFGPIAVTRSSAPAFRAVLGVAFGLNVVLALAVVLLVLKRRSTRATGS